MINLRAAREAVDHRYVAEIVCIDPCCNVADVLTQYFPCQAMMNLLKSQLLESNVLYSS